MTHSTHRRSRVAALIGTIAAFGIIIASMLLGIAAREPRYVFPFFLGLLVLDIAGSALLRSMNGWDFEERRIRSHLGSSVDHVAAHADDERERQLQR